MIETDALEAILTVIGAGTDNYWGGDGWEWDFWTYPSNAGPHEIPGVGTVEIIDVHELGEGDWGGECYIIFRVTDPNGDKQLWKKEGHYQSYEGTSWDTFRGFYPVEAKREYVTVYE